MKKYEKILSLLCVTVMFTSCGNIPFLSKKNNEENQTPVQNQVQESKKSENTPAYITLSAGEEYIELKQSPESDNALCRLYSNDEVTLNYIDGTYANISVNGFTGYVELSSISFSVVETPTETQAQVQEQAPAETPAEEQVQVQEQAPVETQAVPVQATDNNINIENKIENNITIEFALDDFQVKYATPLSYPKYVENKTEGYCIVESCYIFSEPSSDSYKDVKYMVYKDSGVEILGSVDDWYFIRRDFGSQSYRIGYVPKSYIALGASPEIQPSLCSQVIVSKGSACINKYPKICEGDDVLGYAKQGQVYDVYDLIDNYWYKISYGSDYAYISHKMVEPY